MTNVMQLVRQYCATLFILSLASFSLLGCKSVTTNDTVDYKSAGAVRGHATAEPGDVRAGDLVDIEHPPDIGMALAARLLA